MSQTPERKREWAAEKREQRRLFAKEFLGAACAHKSVDCEGSLEFDHINPDTKVIKLSYLWTAKEDLFLEELKKCQLLCKFHHKKKTAIDRNYRSIWYQLECPVCHSEFSRQSRSMRGKISYCSVKCRNIRSKELIC